MNWEGVTQRRTPAGLRFEVRVQPRASRSAIIGAREGRLVVHVTAPPVDAAANDAVIELLARECGVPRRAVRIVSGERHRNKTVEISQ